MTQPASKTVTVGQAASFSVVAAGTAPLSYQWKKNNVALTGATSSSYTTPVTVAADNGAQFAAVVSDSAGSATTNPATLTVTAAAIAPSITTQPASQTVTAGQTASFSVVATGTAPLTYQWMKDNVAIAGATSSSYTTPVTASSDNGAQFTAVISDPAGNVTTNPATLTVTAAAVAPSITTQPASQTITVGQAASFSVVATGTAPLTYQWKKNNVAITGATSSSYTTPLTTSSDNGAQFTAVVSDSAGSVTTNPATLTVSAAAVAPSITTQPASQTVTVGQSASFSVVATGTAPLSYQWKKNSVAITGATSSSYTTPLTVTSDNAAQFVVVVGNSAGSVTSGAALLTVNASTPPLQITTSQLTGGTVGSAYSFTLSASGGSTPYAWSLPSGTLPNGLSLSTGGTISGTPSLAGSFSFAVQVNDAAGHSASATFSINVVAAAAPTVSISSPANGSTVSGTITVSGVASDSIAISSVQLSVDGGSFANASGTSSWSFSLNTNFLSNGAHTLSAKLTDSSGGSATSSLVDVTVNNSSTSTNCTLFASPSGSDSNSGTSSSAPKSFSGAANSTQPGSVVCLLGGTYNLSSSFSPSISGTPSSWIVYQNYDSTPVNFVWTGAANASAMFYFGGGSFPSNPAYLQFQGLHLDGQGNAADGFFCRGSHHLRFLSNSISNTGGSGIASIDCDYLTADHNLISHNGYIPSSTSVPTDYSWTSAISFNSNQWFDTYTGFHNFISNNIIAGEVDQSSHHTDGNGIILDLSSGSYTPSTANTPPALILNNAVYGNGGRCIVAYVVTNFWIVNNTCYNNDLDTSESSFGSIEPNDSHDGYIINNIAVAYQSGHPPFEQAGTVTNAHYYSNLYFGASNNFSYSDPSQFLLADPLFLTPPILAANQFSTALAPALLGNALTLLPLSPAYGRGIDPSTLSGLPAALVSDLKAHIYTDINGKTRPQGGAVDLGAYQH
jgi:hypothetical protein